MLCGTILAFCCLDYPQSNCGIVCLKLVKPFCYRWWQRWSCFVLQLHWEKIQLDKKKFCWFLPFLEKEIISVTSCMGCIGGEEFGEAWFSSFGQKCKVHRCDGLLCLKKNAYIGLFVFLQNNVQIFHCDSNRVQGCPIWISSMFISGCHWELFRRICASLNSSIIAVSLEMVKSPIKGYIMWIPKNVAGAGIQWITSQESILHLANFTHFTCVWIANYSSISSTYTLAYTVWLPKRFSFLLETRK